MISKHHKIKKGFNLLAPFYDVLKFPFTLSQPESQILILLPSLLKESSHLIIGGGTGKYTSIVAKNLQPKNLFVVDISNKMLSLTQNKIGNSNAHFFNGDIIDGLNHYQHATYLHLPFILDCLDTFEINRVIELTRKHNYRYVVVQDFNFSPSRLGKIRDRLLHSFFLPILKLNRNYIPDLRNLFLENGFSETAILKGSLTFTSVFELRNDAQKSELQEQ